MSSPLDLRIGTLATDTDLPVWPAEDHEGRPYIKNGIATVNLGKGKFAVVSAGRDPNPEAIKVLKDRVANGNVEEFETTPQDFSGVVNNVATGVTSSPAPILGTFADQLNTEAPAKKKRGEE